MSTARLVVSDSAAPYQYSWNTTAVANGAAQLKAVAYDAAGNSTQSAIVTVNVANVVTPPPDTTPPTVSIASPTGGNVVRDRHGVRQRQRQRGRRPR